MKKLVFAFVLAPSLAAANPLEVGGALGGHLFSDSGELGSDDLMDDPGPLSAGLMGARIGYPFIERLAAEAEAMMIPTKDDVLGDRAMVLGLRTHARFDLLTGRFRPFLVAGLGLHLVRSDSIAMENDSDRAYHWGGGVRFRISNSLEARLDARHLIVPDRTVDGATSDLEVTAGMTFRIGAKPPKKAAKPMVVGPTDKDGDRVMDASDRCVDVAEDRDRYQDSDGCPDPDNDNDRVLDAADKCPLVKETDNGFNDEDGCPDELIEDLGGIGFARDSAIIDNESGPLLDKAYKLMADHPALDIEISGHTSSDGNYRANLALSLKRAQAVKDHLVNRGIDESRISAVGHGSDVPFGDNATSEGRRLNRRIEFRILGPKDGGSED